MWSFSLRFLIHLLSRLQFRTVLLISACIAVIRCAIVIFIGDKGILSVEDYNIALNLAHGFGFSIGDAHWPTAVKAPLYPLLLSVFVRVFDADARLAAALFQHILLSLSAVLLFASLQRRLSTLIASVTSLCFLFHPSYLVYPSTLESTNLFVPLSIACIWLYGKIQEQRRIDSNAQPTLCVFVLATAALVLCQPLSLPLVVLAMIRMTFPRATRVVVVLSLFLLLSPWAVRNAYVFGTFIPLKSPVWMNLYSGFSTRSHGMAELNTIYAEDATRVDSAQKVLNDVDLEPFYKEAVVHAVTNHPWRYAQKCLVQCCRYWTIPPWYDSSLLSIRVLVGRILPVLLLLWGVFASLWLTEHRYKHDARLIVLTLLYFTVVYAVTHTSNIRFKLDIEWLQCVSLALVVAQRWSTADSSAQRPTSPSPM